MNAPNENTPSSHLYGGKSTDPKVDSRSVGEVLGDGELVVEHGADVGVEAVGEREALLLPRVVLRAERGDVGRRAPLGEVLVRELGLAHVAQDVRLGRGLLGRRGHCRGGRPISI